MSPAEGTLAGWSEGRILGAMRAWRHGCGPLLPWFRATPFAAAHHYRDRTLPIVRQGRPPAVIAHLLGALPAPESDTLWIFDVPAPLGLWLACALRRRWALAAALPWNGWYDPDGVLDGRDEIPLLLGLGPAGVARGSCLIFDAGRHPDLDGAVAGTRLDNRYTLGDDDVPAATDLRAAGWRRVSVWAGGELAADLAEHVEYLRRELPVTVATHGASAPRADG